MILVFSIMFALILIVPTTALASIEDCFPYQAQAERDAAAQNWTATQLDNAKSLECIHANYTSDTP